MKIAIVLILIAATPVSAGIYKWTDSEGNVHFGDRPADSESATELDIKYNNKTGITNSSGNKKEREYLLKKIEEDALAEAEKKKKRIAVDKKRRKLCSNYKSRYQVLIQSNRSYTMSPDGKRTYQSDEQRAARKKALKKSISKYCR